MNFSQKINELQNILEKNLLPNISKECIYLDIPYYLNIGDTLIWDGTDEFLEKNNIKCLYKASCDTYKYRKISSDTTILLQGGGNFGDLWQKHQDFRLKIINDYPENNIVVLPQTIFYNDINKAKADAKIMGAHKNLIICARDDNSHNFLKEHFTENKVLLVPDMAFYISENKLAKYRVKASKELLLLKRKDKELKEFDLTTLNLPQTCDIRDWPTMEGLTPTTYIFYKISKLNDILRGAIRYIVDLYGQRILKRHLIKKGVKFVSSYKEIYSTRLHVAILSVLLHKPFAFLDNSYGKNKGFYEIWLADLEDVKFISEDD